MSRISDLIAQLCPVGVEFKTLDELGATYGGLTGKSKADFAAGNARFVSYVNVFNNGATNVDPDDRVAVSVGERQNRVEFGDVLFTGSSENANEAGMSSVVTRTPPHPLYLNSFCFGFRLEDPGVLDSDFAKHLFRSPGVRRQLVRTANGVTRFNVSKARFLEVRVPIPPIELQLEIARTLDSFSRLEAELEGQLEAELEARRSQYEFYRDRLFAFSDQPGVPWVPMAEVGDFVRGRRFTKADYVEDGVGCIHYGEIYTHYGTSARSVLSHVRRDLAPSLRYAQPGDVVLTDVGETVEDVGKAVAWLGEYPVAIHDHCYAFRHSLNPSFVSYYIQTRAFQAQKNKHVARTKVKTLLMGGLGKVQIPVPPLEEQKRIVETLDDFDALVTDLSIGLPAEITARGKQYEYYRDGLLTFEEAPA